VPFRVPLKGLGHLKGAIEAESFPLRRYTVGMYPPDVTDDAIRKLIRELAVGESLPSGALLRAVLKQRFGSPGGVSRVYRLLSQAHVKKSVVRTVDTAEVLERELKMMRERAERAEQREEAHQSRWAMEVDQLRLKVTAVGPQAQEARIALESVGLLRRQLQVAEARIAMLEQQLIEATAGNERKR
jgi:hypothetical protein